MVLMFQLKMILWLVLSNDNYENSGSVYVFNKKADGMWGNSSQDTLDRLKIICYYNEIESGSESGEILVIVYQLMNNIIVGNPNLNKFNIFRKQTINGMNIM